MRNFLTKAYYYEEIFCISGSKTLLKLHTRERPVASRFDPGRLLSLIPQEAPEGPDRWEDVMADVEHIIMPSVTVKD